MIYILLAICVMVATLHFIGFMPSFDKYISIEASPWPYRYFTYVYVFSLVVGYMSVVVVVISELSKLIENFIV